MYSAELVLVADLLVFLLEAEHSAQVATKQRSRLSNCQILKKILFQLHHT